MEIDTEEKKVERKRKNREAAKQFRERQKNLQADLELEVEQLETESASMTSHISQLEAENTLLHVLLKDMREQIVAQGTQSPGNLQVIFSGAFLHCCSTCKWPLLSLSRIRILNIPWATRYLPKASATFIPEVVVFCHLILESIEDPTLGMHMLKNNDQMLGAVSRGSIQISHLLVVTNFKLWADVEMRESYFSATSCINYSSPLLTLFSY